jgi:hypothetical protein
MKKTKVWIGVGAFVVAGAGLPHPVAADHGAGFRTRTSAPAQMQTSAGAITVAQHRSTHGGEGEGGEKSKGRAGNEGGEGGEAGNKGLPPDLDFALKIALMRGHLLIGDQLVKEKQWNAAFPHFGHPAEELYGAIRNRLKEYGAPPFEAALRSLSNIVKSKKGGEDYTKAYQVVMTALDAADSGIKVKQSNWAAFAVAAALEVLKTSTEEYEEAIVKGRIAKPVEYQDARGFILQAEAMIESVAPDLEKKNADALKGVRAAIGHLKEAFPTAMPPKTPIKDYGAVLSDVSRVELAAGPLL